MGTAGVSLMYLSALGGRNGSGVSRGGGRQSLAPSKQRLSLPIQGNVCRSADHGQEPRAERRTKNGSRIEPSANSEEPRKVFGSTAAQPAVTSPLSQHKKRAGGSRPSPPAQQRVPNGSRGRALRVCGSPRSVGLPVRRLRAVFTARRPRRRRTSPRHSPRLPRYRLRF